MKVCGLTGGIGMGKSAATEFLRARRVPAVDTDELARQLVQPGQPALAEIQAGFGKDVLAAGGRLHREKLAQIIFADAGARRKLEAILHPRIQERWQAQVEIWRRENHPLAVVVIPLLFETGAEPSFDKIICVACSGPTQRERLLARGWTPDQIRQRLAAQWPIDRKIARSDFVIWTDGTMDTHTQQLEQVLAAL